MARPRKELDFEKFSVFCRLKPTREDCAAFFECSTQTIERRIKDECGEDMTFRQFRDEQMVHTRFNLIRNAIGKANKGDNTMLIFCLKNICDWKDKSEVDQNFRTPDSITFVEK